MGVPILRTKHLSSTKQGPGPIATSRSDSKSKLSASLKKPYEKPLVLRTHSLNQEMPPRSVSNSNSGSPGGSKRMKEPDLAGDLSKKASRKIASNSRIRKEEQNKREMYLLFVNNAFKTKSEFSSSSPYNYAQLNNWLLALSHVVSQLDKRYVALVESIIHMPWTTSPDETFVKSYVNFVGMLVSARTEWVNMLVA
ncbi:10839_t:CDS:2, partial [Acaulospora colombiana]